jgi:hypothetical protein
MGTINPRFSQPADQSINVSVTQNTYSIPNVMDQMFLANSASTLPQCHPPYLGSTPSGTPTGIPHLPYFLTAGFAHGNNYIGVINIKSPTCLKQSKKQNCRSGVVELPHPESTNVSIRYVVQGSILINSI